MMHSYTEIKTQEDMEKLLDGMSDFQDSMAKELHIANRGFVQTNHSMMGDHRLDAQVLIQSQWPPYAIELVFCDVTELHLIGADIFEEAEGNVIRSPIKGCRYDVPAEYIEIEMNFREWFRITAHSLFYRVRGEWLGKKARLTSEVPSAEAIPAVPIDENWRQCSGCADAWEAPPENEFDCCPGCNQITQLVDMH